MEVEHMAARKLRAVAPGEKPAPRTPRARTRARAVKTVAEAVAKGTARDQLVAMRARIAKAIDDPNIRGADLAALSRRLLEIGRELEAMDTAAAEEAAEDGPTPDEKFDAEAL